VFSVIFAQTLPLTSGLAGSLILPARRDRATGWHRPDDAAQGDHGRSSATSSSRTASSSWARLIDALPFLVEVGVLLDLFRRDLPVMGIIINTSAASSRRPTPRTRLAQGMTCCCSDPAPDAPQPSRCSCHRRGACLLVRRLRSSTRRLTVIAVAVPPPVEIESWIALGPLSRVCLGW